jgi:hypothetical protein
MRVDHLVADLVVDVRRLTADLELFELLLPSCFFGNDDLLVQAGSGTTADVSGLQIAVHEVDLLQTAKALADVLRPLVPHSLDGFEL